MQCEPKVKQPATTPAVGKTQAGGKLWDLTVSRVIVATLILASGLWVWVYFRITRMVDRRLADGPFSASVDILAAPATLSVGDPMTSQDILRSLRLSGYTREPGNPAGWFAERPPAVEIFPGAASPVGAEPVRLAFAKDGISSIVSLNDQRALQEYRLDPPLVTNLSAGHEKRRLVRFGDIPLSLVQAVVSVEDKRFFQHGGFDFQRILKAAYVDVKDGRKQQGASTLTMQLTRSLWLDRGKSWRRKVEEGLITAYLEQRLTKQQIFEDYANQIYLGQRGTFSINGFGEAARVFLGKNLRQIDTADAALLTGVVRRPSYYNPLEYPERARQRRNLVLALMAGNGYLSDNDYRRAAAEPLHIAPDGSAESASSYFLDLLNHELKTRFSGLTEPNRTVYTTLDPRLQQAAEAAVASGMKDVDQQLRAHGGSAVIPPDQPQVALIALDPRTGEIKALVGGRDYAASQLNHVLAMRQPGSLFKPFVYAAAIATAVEGGPRIFTPASIVNDVATTFSYGNQMYQPRDYHDAYMGNVSLRTALAHSLNAATVSLAQQVGYKSVVAMARRAGWNDNLKPTPAVALGAYEATPLEIAGVYTMFANQGMAVRPTAIKMVRSQDGTLLYSHQPESRAAVDPRVAYLMVNMMEEVLRSGTGAGARSRGFTLPAAGKTGTSRDGWFAGFTSDLLCVVWVGFDDNRDLNLEGAQSALPIWADFMRRASQFRQYGSVHEFQPPPGVVSAVVCSDSGLLAGPDNPNVHREFFIAGTEPTQEGDCSPDSPGEVSDSTGIQP